MQTLMLAGEYGSIYLGEISPFSAGTEVYYYVEARAPSLGTIDLLPAKADFGALSYQYY